MYVYMDPHDPPLTEVLTAAPPGNAIPREGVRRAKRLHATLCLNLEPLMV